MNEDPADQASPPCLAGEVAQDHVDPLGVDDVARWRQAERRRLLEARAEIPVARRGVIEAALIRHLSTLIDRRAGDPAGLVISGFWPIKGEPDLRGWLAELHDKGATVALPVVETRSAPLVFRRWAPGMRMVRGHWNIPVPPPEAPEVVPAITLAPLVGWDAEGYRLGYGGGYFDRTLAAFGQRPFAVGIGLQSARLATIHPQPHDIGLDAIVTEAGLQFEREGPR
ncbi:5-formyltetrahydrofolate cyclo-ligase [Ostreiculturibacter nitratireducens]|uniref:5-formyltetrahydrofolate cyclo-ligase n=1 Tax=Ostreiculturibacter nitratireducens TaxID=3075226 RepID=UPI0031B5DC92